MYIIANPEDPIFYTYILLDPRIKGTFIYDGGNLILGYLPIYGGKGSYKRCYDHLKEAINTDKVSDKLDIIREIIEAGLEPKIEKVLENVTEKEAYAKERYVIKVVGRADIGLGPLTNKTDGGEGGSGRQIEDLTGQTFGRLEVKEFIKANIHGHSKWLCVCECGNEKIIQGIHLKSDSTKSCGCLRNENIIKIIGTYGLSKSAQYDSYNNMLQKFKNIVCDRWLESFENFYEDMGDKPIDKHLLGRIDKNSLYEPNNCKWMTKKERYNDKKNTIHLTINNETHSLKEWSNISGTNYSTMKDRNRKGWNHEEIIYGRV